jgi:hypothetical protein
MTVKHVKEVLRIGTAAMIDANQLAPGMRIGGLGEDTASRQGNSLTVRREAISADPHAEGLMLKYDCDIAVSSSTLLALFDATTTTAVSESVRGYCLLLIACDFEDPMCLLTGVIASRNMFLGP